MSFLKFIVKPDADVPKTWLQDVEAAYRHATPQEKAFFMMDQAVMCNYLMRLYGEEGMPVLLAHYKNTLITWFLPDLEALYTKFDKTTRDQTVNMSYNNVCVLLGKTPGKIDATECTKVLSLDLEVPRASDVSFYAPYVLFVERTFGLYTDHDAVAASRSFAVSAPATIPSFKIEGRHLTVRYEVLFPSYKFDYKKAGQLHQENVPVDSILSYWSGYNWSGIKFSGVLGVLAAQCLERDTNAIPKGSKMIGYLDIYNKVMKGTGISDSLALSSDATIQRRHITTFLTFLRANYNVVFDDSKLLGMFISGTPGSDNIKLHDYLVTDNPTEVSVEMYNAFKRSCFGTFSELDFVQNGRTGRENQAGYLNAKEEPKKENDPDAQDNPEESEDPKKQAKEKKPKEGEQPPADTPTPTDGPTAPEDSGTNTDETDATPEPEAGNQDSPSTDNSASDATTAETTPDEEPNSDMSSTDETGGTDTHTQNTQKLPPVPKLDDKRGVKLSLSEGESTNTVLYRKELGAYLDSLLANPPSSLSVQVISALKLIRSSWLNMLTVTDLHDYLAALVKLPKSITIKK